MYSYLIYYRFRDILQRKVEHKLINFNDESKTNYLLKQHNFDDNDFYPPSTKMVLKSSSSFDLQLDCHSINLEIFLVDSTIEETINMLKIYDIFNSGSIKNDEEKVIAMWTELPTKYIKVIIE